MFVEDECSWSRSILCMCVSEYGTMQSIFETNIMVYFFIVNHIHS